MKRWRRIRDRGVLLLCPVLSVVFFLLGTVAAFAHANLVRSDPTADATLPNSPPQVRLWFSEAPEPRFSQIQLFDRTGKEIASVGVVQRDAQDDKLVTASLPPLEPNIYTVSWRMLSAVDGHVTAGAFAFAVGLNEVTATDLRPVIAGSATGSASTPTVSGVVTRWLGYLSLALLMGGFAFVPLVLQPALKIPAQPRDAAIPELTRVERSPFSHASGLFRLLVISWVVAFAATIFGAWLQAATSASLDLLSAFGTPLLTLITGTRYGAVFIVRVLLLAGIGGLLAFRQSRRWQTRYAVRLWRAGIGLTALLLLMTSLGSHAAAEGEPVLPIMADWLHMLAASVWIGGLVTLLLALRWIRDTASPNRGLITARLVGRFSQLATVCVAVIAFTGVLRAVDEVADWSNLLDTPYGQVLLLKLALLVPLLGFAALNLFYIQRRIAKAARTADSDTAIKPLSHLIRQTVGSEIVFVTAILLITGVLTSLPPSRDAFGSGLVVRAQAADLRVVLSVNPGLSGLNTFDVYLARGFGQPVADAQKVALIFNLVEHDMGQSEAVAENQGDGHYVAQGGFVSMFGTWRVELVIRRTGQDDVRTTLTLPIRATPRSTTSTAFAPVLVYPSRAIIGVEAIAASVILLLASRRLTKARRWAGWMALAVGAVLIGVGIAAISSGFVNSANSPITRQNPVLADATSLANGKLMFDANCVVCHGPRGAGDGPAAATLNPKPANLRVHMAAGHTDGQLYEWISQGIDGTSMPAFEGRLSEQQRWDVINYIRTFAGSP